MAAPAFELVLLDTSWLTDEEVDQCLHGKVRVRIGEAQVVVDDLNVVYGARGALKTLKADHRPDANDPLFPHACSLVFGCPVVAIDWSVRHVAASVRLDELLARGGDDLAAEPQASTSVSLDPGAYRRSVIEFAGSVRAAYGRPDRKVIAESWERELFEDFWSDFDRLYATYASPT